MLFTITNAYRNLGNDILTFKTNMLRKLARAILFLNIFCITSLKSNADWWTTVDHTTNSAGSRFTVNFNPINGTVHIESYAYNGEYLQPGANFFAMWVQSTLMSYSLDEINYVDFYKWGFNRTGIQNLDNHYPNYVVNMTAKSSNGDEIFYLDLQLNDATKNIKFKKITTTLGGGNFFNGVDAQDIFDSKQVCITQMSTISAPTILFLPVLTNQKYVAKARISYTKANLNDVDNQSGMILYDASVVPNKKVTNNAVSTNGFVDVDVANISKNYYFQQVAYTERISSKSDQVTVPAFTFPKTASAVYDPFAQQVTFSWTIDPVLSPNVIKDRFKIQISNNMDFNPASEINVDYDQTQSGFSYVVNKKLSPIMYFRVARDRSGFNWELAKTISTTISFTRIPLTATATLNNKSSVLTWTPVDTAWVPGATFIITRINNTSNTQNQISLSKADFDKGTYTDVQISTCNSYNYSLQVIPEVNTNFNAFAPVQIPNEILRTEIGSLIRLEVSKGYFPDRTELHWLTKGSFDNFIIKRAVYGTNNFVQMASVPGSINSEYQTDDAKGTPGVYYSFQVIGTVKCNNTNVFSNETPVGIGFRSPTGNIYGRVNYENGQAVEDVSVRLQSNDQAQLGKSIYLNGTPASYLQLDITTAPFSDSAFTIEAWIKPNVLNPANQVIFYSNKQYVLGFNAAGSLFFSYKADSVAGTYSNPTNSFVHVTGIHTKDSLFIMLNNDIVGRIAVPFAASMPDKKVYVGRSLSNQGFAGYIEELRIYNVAISQVQAIKNQNLRHTLYWKWYHLYHSSVKGHTSVRSRIS